MPSRVPTRPTVSHTPDAKLPKSTIHPIKDTITSRRDPIKSKRDIRDVKHAGITSKSNKIMKPKAVTPKKKRRKKPVKTWLKTPADWAQFYAWAQIKAQPRKYPEPEPIIRPSKPLHLLRRRIKLLSENPKRGDPSKYCKPAETEVSRAALNAVTTKRLLKLSLPKLHICDYGRELPTVIHKATLQYIPSKRIQSLSQPKIFEPEECKPVDIPSDTKNKRQARKRLLKLKKKLIECPEGLTDEEKRELFTDVGIRKSALTYEITPWMEILALPGYTILKFRDDEDAEKWKKMFLENYEVRGKKAIEEQRKRIEEKEKKEKKKKKKKEDEEKEKDEGDEKKDEETKDEKTEKETAEKRKQIKHAWRYAPLPCKTYEDAFFTKKAALNAKASPRTNELAKHTEHKDLTTKEHPYDVKKSALSATSSGRTNELAKPKQPRDPIEKPPPREKNIYGQIIFIKPIYGKVLPKTKPYKMGECPKKEDKKEKKKKKERSIDPIVYEPTIDPCIYPKLAKKQMRERKRIDKRKGKIDKDETVEKHEKMEPEPTATEPEETEPKTTEPEGTEPEGTEPEETENEEN
ncbi:calponin homology domain-containing protein DDB_G0272472-like [Vespa velutina]|uniref:calponin homology domain-containing protein DDB_G0272472-like n=1 Tax=Vespa velutina TaxID=202808 RepID=UPI001FB47E19|nr:calponin homology domain-containing protein DDB_G0272472-like [Vespa velutina]